MAEQLYRWADAQGRVHYTDALPPEAAEQNRSLLDKRGVAVKEIEPLKSKEQYVRDQELKHLRAEEDRLKQEQAREDALLLNLYSSEEEIRMARDGKMAALDGLNEITRVNIQRLKVHLEKMQQDAADAERAGRSVAKALLNRIEEARQKIKQGFESLIEREQQKAEINEKFLSDLRRYRTIKKLDEPKPEKTLPPEKPSLLETVAQCADTAACDAAWVRAEAYVRKEATTRIQMLGRNIIVTAPPVKPQDISLAVSRIEKPGRPGAQLFLNVQCKDSSAGAEFCAGDRVARVRHGFRAFISPPAPADQPSAGAGSNSAAETAGH